MSEALLENARALYRAGQLGAAANCCRQLLRENPRHFEALHTLAIVTLKMGHLEEGQHAMGEALKLNPRFAEGWCSRGIVLLQLRRREEALACLDQALAIRRDFPEALASRATALLELNRLDAALTAFNQVVALAPNHAISWNNRGNAFVAMGRFEEAVASFERAMALDPSLETARDNRDMALLQAKRSTRIPPKALAAHFDEYSSYFESALVDRLGYRGPQILRVLANRVMPQAQPPLDILDFGCGTGLCGEAFRDWSEGGRLDGVDLSQGMLDKARARGIYTDLVLADFETALPFPDRLYDLVIATDALIYLGELARVYSGAAARLEPGGMFLFTVEKHSGSGWEQTQANRFRHSEDYLRKLADATGFAVAETEDCATRNEGDAPVPFYAVALRKRS